MWYVPYGSKSAVHFSSPGFHLTMSTAITSTENGDNVSGANDFSHLIKHDLFQNLLAKAAE